MKRTVRDGEEEKLEGAMVVPIDLIDDPELPLRSDLSRESVAELAGSIKQYGVIEPLVIKRKGKRYEVVAGHRRLVAAIVAGLVKVPCVIYNAPPEDQDLVKIHENVHREALNPVDEAYFLEEVQKRHKLTRQQLANLIGRVKSYVDDRLAVRNYPLDVKQALHAGLIVFSVAREFAKVKDEMVRSDYLHHAIEGGVTPELALKWRRIWEDARAAETPRSPETAPLVGAGQEHEYSVKCDLCLQPVALSRAKVLYAHDECVQELKK